MQNQMRYNKLVDIYNRLMNLHHYMVNEKEQREVEDIMDAITEELAILRGNKEVRY